MKKESTLNTLLTKASNGAPEDIDYILGCLTPDVAIETTKFIDYALSLVENDLGIKRIEFYLFKGSQIQRNYCSLFFNRRGDWDIVKKAYEHGLIDEIQAFAR